MRILALYPYVLAPDRLGGLIRARLWIERLARSHEVTLVQVVPPEEEAWAADAGPIRRTVAAWHVVPVTERKPTARLLDVHRGVPPQAGYLGGPEGTAFVGALVRRERFDAAFVEFAFLGEYGRLLREAGVPAVLSIQEMPSRRYEREWKGALGAGEAIRARVLELLWRRYEGVALRRFSDLWLISTEEQAYAREWLALRDTYRFPNLFDPATVPDVLPDPARKTAVFLGNFAHGPNADGLRWLLAEVWPRVRAAEPEATLGVCGRDANESQIRAMERAGVTWRGFVPTLADAFAPASVALSPMVSGGGMRGKVLEALAAGRPVVATPIGAEGVARVPGLHVAASPEDFARAVIDAWGEDARGAVRSGAARVREQYSPEAVLADAEARLVGLAEWRGAG